MRKLMLSGVLMMGLVIAAIGCGGSDNRGQAKIPEQPIALPKNDPVPAGTPGAGKPKPKVEPPNKAVGD